MSVQNSLRNLIDLCRLCMEKDRSLVPIFNITDTTDELCSKISSCLSIEVSRADELSKKICKECLIKVESFYEFWCQAAKTQRQFNEWLSDNKRIQEELKKSSYIVAPQLLVQVQMRPPFQLEGAKLASEECSSKCGEKSDGKNNEPRKDPLDIKAARDGQAEEVESGEVNQRLLPEPAAYNSQEGTQPGSSEPNPIEEENEIKVFQGGVTQLECMRCGAVFEKARYLARHMKRHTAERTVPCRLCSKKFLNNSEMKEHLKSHQLGDTVGCELCSYRSRYKSNLLRHLRRHRKEYAVWCRDCGEGFFSKDELATHRIKRHDETPFQCLTCGRAFSSRNYLYEHEKNTHQFGSRDFLCETCGKAFKSKSATKRHSRTHSETRFPCTLCPRLLASAYSLKKHLRTHTGEKNVVCHVCGKAFADAKYMVAHMRSHTGERPYTCSECGRGFTQATSLKVHIRYHTGERPYTCDLCSKSFITRTLLNNHLKTHTEIPSLLPFTPNQ